MTLAPETTSKIDRAVKEEEKNLSKGDTINDLGLYYGQVRLKKAEQDVHPSAGQA